MTDVSRAIEIKVQYAKTYYRRGLVYMVTEAKADFAKASKLDPYILKQ
jgi:hypothetical protein